MARLLFLTSSLQPPSTVYIYTKTLVCLTSAPSCLSPSLLPSSLVVCPLLCFLLLWLSVSLFTPEEDICCGKHLYTIVSLYFVALVSGSVFPRSVLFCQPHQQLFTHSSAVSSQRNLMLCVRNCFPPIAGLSCRVPNCSGRCIPLL